jgi:hypothetical protein
VPGIGHTITEVFAMLGVRLTRQLGVCCLALALPVLVGAKEKGSAVPRAAIAACAQAPDVSDPEDLWRVRADRQLQCVIGMLDEALKKRNGDVVTLTRSDAERLRALAFWAKDAAARIGR